MTFATHAPRIMLQLRVDLHVVREALNSAHANDPEFV